MPPFFGRFFTSGRSAPGRSIEITEGLWELLEWCWSRSPRERERSALCRKLILAPEVGWREEPDVVEAMARNNHPHNPARPAPEEVAGLVAALLAEGEAVRGRRARLEVHLDFVLPRLNQHPLFSPQAISAALRAAGTPAPEVHEHLTAVHPERLPYRGTWILTLQDRLQSVPAASQVLGTENGGCVIAIADPRLGRRSHVLLRLRHPPALAGYFALSLGINAAGGLPAPASGAVSG